MVAVLAVDAGVVVPVIVTDVLVVVGDFLAVAFLLALLPVTHTHTRARERTHTRILTFLYQNFALLPITDIVIVFMIYLSESHTQ